MAKPIAGAVQAKIGQGDPATRPSLRLVWSVDHRSGFPKDHAENLSRARALHAAGEIAEAIVELENVTRSDPACVEAIHKLGMLSAEIGNADRAALELRRAVDLDPTNARIWFDLGWHIAFRSPRKARDAIDHAIALDPGFAEAYVARGWMKQYNRHLNAAERDYREALSIAKTDDAVSFFDANIGDIFCHYFDHVETDRDYISFYIEGSAYSSVYFSELRIAPVLKASRMDWVGPSGEAATRAFAEAAKRCPTFFHAHRRLGTILVQRSRFQEALGPLDEAIALRTDDLKLRALRVIALGNLGRTERAVKEARDIYPGPEADVRRIAFERRRLREFGRGMDENWVDDRVEFLMSYAESLRAEGLNSEASDIALDAMRLNLYLLELTEGSDKSRDLTASASRALDNLVVNMRKTNYNVGMLSFEISNILDEYPDNVDDEFSDINDGYDRLPRNIENYLTRRDKSENPLVFLDRVWAKYIAEGLALQGDITARDPKLVQNVRSYCQRNKLSPADYLPPKGKAELANLSAQERLERLASQQRARSRRHEATRPKGRSHHKASKPNLS